MKRILSLMIALCLVCSFIQVPAIAEETVYPEAAETLEALGIMEGFGGDLMLDKVLTRAEFVSMIVRVLGVENTGATVYFEDVGANHWAVGSVAAACALGIVKGVDDKHFAPDEPLAFEEAVKMLVVTLGYEPVAIKKGAYPAGYLTVAQQIGLLDEITGKAGLIVKRELASELLFNALSVNMITEKVVGEDITGKIKEGVTLLSEKMKIAKGEGILTANEITSLSKSGGVADGMVLIGETLFDAGETGAAEFLGYSVTYYADISTDTTPRKLIYVRSNEKDNEVITIAASDILPETTTTCVEYVEDNRDKSYDVSPYADLIYNGAGTGGFTASNMKPTYGTLTLIDNDKDGEAEVLFVDDYSTIIVGKLIKSTFTAYDADDATKYVELDPDSDDYSFILFENGEPAEFKDVKEDSVLSVTTSANTSGRKKVKVLISDEKASGTLDSIDDETVVIGGVEYELNPLECENASKYLGSEVTAYIDAFGKIVGIGKGALDSFAYGYLIAYDGASKSTLDNRIALKILTELGDISVITCEEELMLDGKSKTDSQDLPTKLALSVRSGGSGIEQVIRYRLNADGNINAIDTVAVDKGGDADSLSLDAPILANRRRYTYNVLGDAKPDILVDDDVVVFRIPTAENKGDDTMYSIGGKSTFASSSYYHVEGYDYEEDMSVNVMVIQDVASAEVADGARMTLVKKVSYTVRDDEPVYKLTGFYNGEATTLYSKTKTPFTKTGGKLLEAGDMIRYASDKFGNVTGTQTVLLNAIHDTATNPTTGLGTNPSKLFANIRVTYGDVIYKNGYNIIVDTTPTVEDDEADSCNPFLLTTGTRVYLVSATKGTVTKVTIDTLEEYIYGRADANVAVVCEAGNPRDVVIYSYE